jgi:ribosome-binding protein aMBF1 (putative translation factor)
MQPGADDRLPSLAHFVIFNPTLARKPPKKDAASPTAERSAPAKDEERDRDLEDDLREAAQIVFYTAREAGGVSRDRMLRQVGLAKGLMGFAE